MKIKKLSTELIKSKIRAKKVKLSVFHSSLTTSLGDCNSFYAGCCNCCNCNSTEPCGGCDWTSGGPSYNNNWQHPSGYMGCTINHSSVGCFCPVPTMPPPSTGGPYNLNSCCVDCTTVGSCCISQCTVNCTGLGTGCDGSYTCYNFLGDGTTFQSIGYPYAIVTFSFPDGVSVGITTSCGGFSFSASGFPICCYPDLHILDAMGSDTVPGSGCCEGTGEVDLVMLSQCYPPMWG